MVTIALAGNPNAGKTTLFNALTGDNQFVGNWPGVTVERREGGWREDPSVRFVDLPGVYSLSPDTPEEVVTRRFLVEQRPDALLNLVDGTNLERNLYLTTQLLELGIPMVVAVNRADLLERRGQKLNRDLLSRRLGCPVVVLSAARGTGVAEAAQAAAAAARRGEPVKPAPLFPPRARRALEDVEILASDHLPAAGRAWYLVKLFEGDQAVDQALGVGLALRQRLEVVIAACERDLEDDREEIIAAGRYAFAGTLARRCLTRGQGGQSLSQRLDRLLLHRVLALPLLAVILLGMFWVSICLVGGWAEGASQTLWQGSWTFLGREHLGVVPLLAYGLEKLSCAPWLTALLVDGVAAGVGAVLVFLPQLATLFLCLTFLEGCGYLSRGAYLLDRGVRRFGLSGKSVVPYVLSCGCGGPGILACRTIRRTSCRRLTAMTATFLPCGAKLPVIALVAGTVIPGGWWVAPLAYLVGVAAALLSSWLLSGSPWFPREDVPFWMELPDYRLPPLGELLRGTGQRLGAFLRKAGSLLLLASVAVWFAASFGWEQGGFGELSSGALSGSLLAGVGRYLAPLFAPLGWGDWRLVVAACSGLLAKESIVSTLGVLCPGGLAGLSLTVPAALSFLLFNLLCAPCLAALAALRQEMASPRHFWFAVAYQTALAWLTAFGVYQVGTLLLRL